MPELNPLSQEFSDVLLDAYPAWRNSLRAVDGGSFTISINCPARSDIEHPFVVTTENDEVTIAIDFCHTHFQWRNERLGLGPFTDPLQHISAILSDEIAAVSYWNAGQWGGSTYISPFEDVDIGGFSGQIRVRSWLGTRNRDIQVATGR